MRKKSILAVVAGLTVAGVLFQPAVTAEAKTHRVKTVKADVDGDGRPDTVKLDRLAKKSHYRTSFRITVKTAAGKKATRTFTVTGSSDTGRITQPLVGIEGVDGVAGDEIALKTLDYARGDSGKAEYLLLTWRDRKLVVEKPAEGVWKTQGSNGLGSWGGDGYVFDEIGGVKTATHCFESGSESYDAENKLITVEHYSMTTASWLDGRWQPASAPVASDTPNDLCKDGSMHTLVLQ